MCAILSQTLCHVERFSSWKLKSLDDIKEEKERQSSQAVTPSKGTANKWRGVPVSPTLVMPNTVFHPGMQPWMGKSQRQPFQQGNPYKFVAKPASLHQSPPVAVEPSSKAVKSPPKATEPPPNAVEPSPKAVKPSTVAAVTKPRISKTSPSVGTREMESKSSTDANNEKGQIVHRKVEVC